MSETLTITSIIPTQISDNLPDNQYDGWAVDIVLNVGDSKIHTVKTVKAPHPFELEWLDDESGMDNQSLLSTFVERLRHVAGL